MRRTRTAIVAVAGLLSLGTAHADWSGKGEAGVVFARGNTKTETVNAKLEMARETDHWKHGFGLSALRAKNAGSKTADRYGGFYQADYKVSKVTFWFGGVRYEKDKFSGFDYQASATTGIGRKFIDNDKTKLTAQAGIGYKRLKNALTGATSDNSIFRGDVKFEHALTATTSIIDTFLVEAGAANTLAVNELALQVKMTDALALAVGVGVRYNTEPPNGLKKTDTLTTVNLVYGF
jgi:putative salt-induced outer membrane protein